MSQNSDGRKYAPKRILEVGSWLVDRDRKLREGSCFLLKVALIIVFIGWIEPVEREFKA